ncbi:hypothetical protein [Subtercola boreus]|uniref:hypothetical protein n=1 Tax=Subtercola boreus TaxID=120213 RepID=UPI00209BC304|nr:hypothetical protein [Subtercola boreus]
MSHRRWLSPIVAIAVAVGLVATGAIAAQATPTDPPGTFAQQNLGSTLAGNFAAYRIPALAYLGNNIVVAA